MAALAAEAPAAGAAAPNARQPLGAQPVGWRAQLSTSGRAPTFYQARSPTAMAAGGRGQACLTGAQYSPSLKTGAMWPALLLCKPPAGDEPAPSRLCSLLHTHHHISSTSSTSTSCTSAVVVAIAIAVSLHGSVMHCTRSLPLVSFLPVSQAGSPFPAAAAAAATTTTTRNMTPSRVLAQRERGTTWQRLEGTRPAGTRDRDGGRHIIPVLQQRRAHRVPRVPVAVTQHTVPSSLSLPTLCTSASVPRYTLPGRRHP